MAEDSKQSIFTRKLTGYAKTGGRRLVTALGGKWIRFFLIVAGVGLACSLLYAYIWKPLSQPVLLPKGITGTNPELDGKLLQSINEARIDRENYKGASLSALEYLYAPSPTPAVPKP
ncbi:MAG: hypothetical protein HYZ62_00665 [Candidatus Andersenbacteria bacterium]|nr:hypothetical protein [Candidatus Andersenbacteria bacterium]